MIETSLRPPERRSTLVAEQLAGAISRGEFKPGDKLPSEKQISETFGVSRPVAREAIRDLVGQGLAHVQQGKAARVNELDAGPLDKFYRVATGAGGFALRDANEMRRVFEPGIAALAATRRDPVGLASIERALEQMHAAIAKVDAFTAADVAFHEAVAQTTGNPMILLQIQGLRPVIEEVSRFLTSRERPLRDWQESYEQHRTIGAAITAGDSEAATARMLAHFARADAALAELSPRP